MRARSQVLTALFFCFSLLGFARQGAFARQVTPPAKSSPALAPAADRRIILDVVVTDRSGNPVPGLQQQDFTLLDNKRPQSILSFRATDKTSKPADSELQGIVLLDTVNTPFQGIAFQREELEKFLRVNGGELPLPMSVGLIPVTPDVLTAATQDGNVLVNALNSNEYGLRAIHRSEGFYGGVERVQISLNNLEKFASYEATQPGRKLVIWLGPGWPLLSGPNVELSAKDRDALFHTVVALSTALRDARVTLYNVSSAGTNASLGRAFYYEEFVKGVTSANRIQSGNLGLQVIAVQSGGRVLNLTNDIAGSVASCLADAKAYYTLSFDSAVAAHPDEYHTLQVKIDEPKLTARTRTGYYAQP
jgi:VWFA-related protein